MSDTSTPSRAEELSLLGSSEHRLPASPEEAKLETFANRETGRAYVVELHCSDFSSLCPVTGQPDAAKILIRYIPAATCIETKSLKFYLASFRNLKSFNEDIVNRILTDLVAACTPAKAMVRGAFAARGGISLTAEARYPDPGHDIEL